MLINTKILIDTQTGYANIYNLFNYTNRRCCYIRVWNGLVLITVGRSYKSGIYKLEFFAVRLD